MTLISGAATVPTRRLAGDIGFTDLPAHLGITVSLQLFRVPAPDAPVPYDGEPPADATTDSTELCDQVDFDTEVQQPARVVPFSLTRPEGHYYLQVRAILFRKNPSTAEDGVKVIGQLEPFFFAQRPVSLLSDMEGVRLSIPWPAVAIEEMETYATFRPGLPPTAP